MSKDKPLVSIWMPSYYAGNYIAEAIESVLCQKTDYPYEIVINDDASGDNTWDVILEYAKKYPDIIHAVRNEKNLGLSANVLATKKRCRGKYIVNLSGDDYWICDTKIQMQADFLEKHPEYIGVGTQVECRYDDEKTAFAMRPSAAKLGKDYTVSSYERGINLPSHGFMMRNIFSDPEKKEIIDGIYKLCASIDDLFDPLLYLRFGRIYLLPESTAVYRVHREKKGRKNFNSSLSALPKVLNVLDGYNHVDALGFQVDLHSRYVEVFNLVILGALQALKPGTIVQAYKTLPPKYRIPWKTSVGRRCLLTVFRDGFNYVKRKIKIKLKK